MHTEQIPTKLKARPQWICWRTEQRNGKETKVPIDPGTGGYASVTDRGTWTRYGPAQERYYADRDVAGLGYVFTAWGPYAGVDLDDCRDPGTGVVDAWAGEIVDRLESYTEISPSGTGLHVLVEGRVPESGNRNGDVELYDQRRFFTVTGRHVPGTPQRVEHRPDRLRTVHEEYVADGDDDDENVSQPPQTQITLDDEELLEKALNAANGDKFRQLWIGDTSGYPSHSEADQALCNFLAFWTAGDEQQMERLFNQSGLVREKWQNRADYRERTIREAVRGTIEFYEPIGDE